MAHLPTVPHADRFYSFLLSFYPREYQVKYREQMMIVFRDLYREQISEHGTIPIIFWIRIIGDTMIAALSQHLSVKREFHFNGRALLIFFFIIPVIASLFSQIFGPALVGLLGFYHFNESGNLASFLSLVPFALVTPMSLVSLVTSFLALQHFRDKGSRFLFYWLGPSLLTGLIYTLPQEIMVTREYPFKLSEEVLNFFFFVGIYTVIPSGLLGTSLGLTYVHIHNRPSFAVIKSSFSFKRFFSLALLLSLFFTFLSGFFLNGVHYEKIDGGIHYFIHRGVPFPYNGVIREGATPPFPLVKLSAFRSKNELLNTPFYKMVHVYAFFQNVFFYFLLSLFPSYIFTTSVTRKRSFNVLIVSFAVLLMIIFWYWMNSVR